MMHTQQLRKQSLQSFALELNRFSKEYCRLFQFCYQRYVKTAAMVFCYLQSEHTLPPKSASKSCPYKSGDPQFETCAGPKCEKRQSLRSAL